MSTQQAEGTPVGTTHPTDKPPTTPPAPMPTPKAWWQWVLVYPTLLVSLAASIPTVLELHRSMKAGVPFGKSEAALQQQDLWSKNMLCTSAPFDGLTNEYNVRTDATICKSGDVLVRFLGPKDRKAYRWVPVVAFDAKVAGFSLMSTAVAQEPPRRQNEEVVCQWSPDPGWVVRRLRDKQTNQCFNERIRTYTGNVEKRERVSCDDPCEGNR